MCVLPSASAINGRDTNKCTAPLKLGYFWLLMDGCPGVTCPGFFFTWQHCPPSLSSTWRQSATTNPYQEVRINENKKVYWCGVCQPVSQFSFKIQMKFCVGGYSNSLKTTNWWKIEQKQSNICKYGKMFCRKFWFLKVAVILNLCFSKLQILS